MPDGPQTERLKSPRVTNHATADDVDGNADPAEWGIEIRDRFAGDALALIGHVVGADALRNSGGAELIAAWAYELADAMMLERAKR